MPDVTAIARLRVRLAAQVGPPLVVSDRPQQYFFDEEHAAYSEIDVKRIEAFVVVVVIGSLPSEDFILGVWHRYAGEVWVVDTRDEQIYVARRDESIHLLDRADTLRSVDLPGVAIPVDALFAPAS